MTANFGSHRLSSPQKNPGLSGLVSKEQLAVDVWNRKIISYLEQRFWWQNKIPCYLILLFSAKIPFNLSQALRVFPKRIENSVNLANSRKLKNHWGMNWGQIKDPLCYLCHVGSVVTFSSLTEEVADSNNLSTMILSADSVKTCRENAYKSIIKILEIPHPGIWPSFRWFSIVGPCSSRNPRHALGR